MDEASVQPAWALGLIRSGLYYDGFVDILEETLEAHQRCTITTYGTRTSKKSPATRTTATTAVPSDTNINKENDGKSTGGGNECVSIMSRYIIICLSTHTISAKTTMDTGL